jgi:tungstate transport system substrate-binding protein
MWRWNMAAFVAILVVLGGCSSAGQTRVVIGAGTTLVDTQFMAELVAAYGEVDPSVELSVVGLSSAQAISLAEASDADVIITHNRAALEEFLVAHRESVRFDVFASKFFIVADPTINLIATSADDAFSVIAKMAYPFVSRDDGSGTNAAELQIWDAIGVDPLHEPWYVRTGTGMGATLQVTDQRHATTLSEHGAFLASDAALSLVAVDNTDVVNPYDLTVVDPASSEAGMNFAVWITSPSGVSAIEEANFTLFAEQVYVAP